MNIQELDENTLLNRARAFDQGALTFIYQTHHAGIYRYIYRHLGNAQTAEDLASDVFRRLLQAFRKGGGPTQRLSAWLYRVAHNLIVDEIRRCKHRDHESLDGVSGDVLKADGDSLEHLAGNALAVERVREALMALTDDQRQVLVLKFLEGLNNAEVATITGKTVGAVKALQHRGLESLRAELASDPVAAPASWQGRRVVAPSFGN
jgi:RNA polymerase sigma-70 factor (ECF subfamily)